MEVKLTLNERLYKDIEDLSSTMGVSTEDYIINIIEDKFYTDKYGDLNNAMNTNKENTSDKKQKNEQVVNKDIGIETKSNICKNTENEALKNEKKEVETIENAADVKIKKRVSRTRTIKSK